MFSGEQIQLKGDEIQMDKLHSVFVSQNGVLSISGLECLPQNSVPFMRSANKNMSHL